MKNNLKICNIPPPNFGYRQHELMQDIAHTVGATYFSEKTGDDLSIINYTDLGHAAKVIVGRDSTVILKDENENTPDVSERVAELRVAFDNATKKVDKDFIMSRIASLTGGIGVIYVGGNTDLEQKELYDRVDDAVCAVRSALDEGIVAGGGVALYNVYQSLDSKQNSTQLNTKKIAYAIMASALFAPIKQILDNAGISFHDVYGDNFKEFKPGEGYDVKGGEFGDMISMGIIDPLKVTRSALQNAVSVAVTILSTNAIVTMARSYETK